jgi:UPF0716 family protein affecting phage T7 exclusion
MIVGQVADQSVIGQLGIFLTIVVAAASHSTGIALRRRRLFRTPPSSLSG